MTTRTGVRRKTRWLDTLVDFSLASGVQGIDSLLDVIAVNEESGLTVIRTLVQLTAIGDSDPTEGGVQRVTVAGAIITADAFTAGAVPDLSDINDEPVNGWMWMLTTGVPQILNLDVHPRDLMGDFRSQRKLTNDTELYISALSDNVSGDSFTVAVVGRIRTLVKLP